MARRVYRLNALDWIALVLVIIGGIDWGLIGLFGIDLIQMIFAGAPVIASIIYVLVGLAALYMIYYAVRPSYVD